MTKGSKTIGKSMLDLRRAMDEVAALVREIEAGRVDEMPPTRLEIMFSRPEDGGLMLSGETADHYRSCLQKLIEVVSHIAISPKTVERALDTLILSSLDMNKRRAEFTLEQRLNNEIDRLVKTINEPPTIWRVLQPVSGLEVREPSLKLGKVEFRPMSQQNVDDLCIRLSASRPIADQVYIEEEMKSFTSYDDHVHAIATVDVCAVDDPSAVAIAQKELRTVIDVINFYTDILGKPIGSRVTIPGETNSAVSAVIYHVHDNVTWAGLGLHRVGALTDFQLRALMDDDPGKTGIDKLQQILRADKRNMMDERILRAMTLSGQATVAQRSDEAFLLYAIALESLVLAKKDREGLTYRMKIYTPHLLTNDITERHRISKEIADLYAVRSNIVHNGSYDVTKANLDLIRLFTKWAILKFLTEVPFKAMTSFDDLQCWFDEQILQ